MIHNSPILRAQLRDAAAPRSIFDSGPRPNSVASQLRARGLRQREAAVRSARRDRIERYRPTSRVQLTRQATELRNLAATLRAMYDDFLER